MIGNESKRRIIRRHLNFNRVPHTNEIYKLITSIINETLTIDRMDRKSRDKRLKEIRRMII